MANKKAIAEAFIGKQTLPELAGIVKITLRWPLGQFTPLAQPSFSVGLRWRLMRHRSSEISPDQTKAPIIRLGRDGPLAESEGCKIPPNFLLRNPPQSPLATVGIAGTFPIIRSLCFCPAP